MFTQLKTLSWTAFALSLLLILPATLFSVNEDAGTTGFNTLKVIYSARGNAMGQAMTGMAKNPDAMQFNPASLLNVENRQINSTFMSYFVDSGGGSIQYVMPRDKYFAYGFFMNYMNMGSMQRTEIDQSGNLIETGETFGAYNLVAGASLANHINDAVDLGGSIKVIYDQIDDSSASAIMLDAAILHHPENERIKVGLSMRNLGFQTTHYTDDKYSEKLPLTFTVGLCYDINPRSEVSFDLMKATGENFVAKLGYEYYLYPSFALRGGYRSDGADRKLGGTMDFLSGVAMGAGWRWNQYNLDYSISSYGDLGYINQLSIAYLFD